MTTPKRRNPKTAGRKSKYKPEYCDQVLKLLGSGFNQTQTIEFLGISRATWDRWKDAHPKFREVVKNGAMGKGIQVIDALYKSALGFESVEKTIVVEKDSSNGEKSTKKVVTKQVGPNAASIQYYLNCRLPENWRKNNDQEEKPTEKTVFVLSKEDLKI